MIKKESNWLLALALTTPLLIYLLYYLFNHHSSLTPTGFIQYDNVSYIAYARQYLDADQSGFFYNNPFNDSGNYSTIYFQTQTIFFALLMKIGFPVVFILPVFTWVCALLCFRLVIAIYDHLYPAKSNRTISLWLFAWGGGILALSGFLLQQILGTATINSIFFLDPAGGWWGLNLGRSLFFSCEAYYHVLFLAVIYCLLKQNWAMTLGLSFILSVSHPFTGIELLAITCAWCFAERFLFGNKSMPAWFMGVQFLILIFHLFYYLYYLNQFAEHRSVNDQYELNWRLRFFNMLPAYGIVGLLAIFSWWRIYTPARFIRNSNNRLFLVWFLVAFALANHELFIHPMQPLHFTRGYIWTALFLIGLPSIHFLLDKFRRTAIQKIAIAGFIALFFLDNLLWIYINKHPASSIQTSAGYISGEQKQILTVLSEQTTNQTLIIGADPHIPYLSTVYTKAYPWISHPFTTPFADRKIAALDLFMKEGIIDTSWQGRSVVFIFRKTDSLEFRRAASISFRVRIMIETKSYKVMAATLP
jgi:hypothetical protein